MGAPGLGGAGRAGAAPDALAAGRIAEGCAPAGATGRAAECTEGFVTGAAGRIGVAAGAIVTGAAGFAAAGTAAGVGTGALCAAGATTAGAAGAAGLAATGTATTAGALGFAAGGGTIVGRGATAAAGRIRAVFSAASLVSLSAFAAASWCASSSATPKIFLRTFSATSAGIELECVFFSSTPYPGSRSMMAFALTSSSRASSLIRT